MDFDEFLGKMQRLLVASQQGDLFGNKEGHKAAAEEACVEFLKHQGYAVGPPNPFPVKIKKLDELISHFYQLVQTNYTNHLWVESNPSKDRRIAKALVEGRMKSNKINRQVAMNQCYFIIETIFKRKDIFKFETPPDFGIFGQKEMSWITERAVELLNKAITEDLTTAAERSALRLEKEINQHYPKLGHSLSELEAMQKRLEEQYGKKEKQT